MEKKCPKCNRSLRIEEFPRRETGKPSSYCKSCQKAYSREHYKRNKHKHNTRRYERSKRHRKEIIEYIRSQKGIPCIDCGQSHPHFAMDFDHRDPSKKLFALGSAPARNKTLQVVKDEIEKCDLVCALCHRYRTYGQKRGVG